MRDYIVTHAQMGTTGFVPRVVRAQDATEALRASIIDLHWQDRRIKRSRHKVDMFDLANYGRWTCDRGQYERDALDVQPYAQSGWNRHRLVRVTRKGRFVQWLND